MGLSLVSLGVRRVKLTRKPTWRAVTRKGGAGDGEHDGGEDLDDVREAEADGVVDEFAGVAPVLVAQEGAEDVGHGLNEGVGGHGENDEGGEEECGGGEVVGLGGLAGLTGFLAPFGRCGFGLVA